MTPDEERLRASEARAGARLLRRHAFARAYDREALAFAARMIAEGSHTNGGMVYRTQAEAMFDWPIYRAALAPMVGAFAMVNGISAERAEPIVKGLVRHG